MRTCSETHLEADMNYRGASEAQCMWNAITEPGLVDYAFKDNIQSLIGLLFVNSTVCNNIVTETKCSTANEQYYSSSTVLL